MFLLNKIWYIIVIQTFFLSFCLFSTHQSTHSEYMPVFYFPTCFSSVKTISNGDQTLTGLKFCSLTPLPTHKVCASSVRTLNL